MAKLKDKPITREDIQEYLESYSDFTFEIKTLNLLTNAGFNCRHSGIYTDPITQKMREFDVRAVKSKKLLTDLCFHLFLAVECKNLKDNFPLVVHCMPRTREEAFEELIFFSETGPPYYAQNIPHERTLTIYQKGKPVGKSTDQLGKYATKDELFTSDSDVFDKISQALNSSYDLIQEASDYHRGSEYNLSLVKPILVVPDATLWQVVYDVNGNVIAGPEQCETVTYYYGKSWEYANKSGKRCGYTISHLDIVTLSHLESHINTVIGFEAEDLVDHLKRLQADGKFTNKVNLNGP